MYIDAVTAVADEKESTVASPVTTSTTTTPNTIFAKNKVTNDESKDKISAGASAESNKQFCMSVRFTNLCDL